MNKKYLKSLAGYLVLNTAIWLLLGSLMNSPSTMPGFLITTCLACVVHRYLIYKG